MKELTKKRFLFAVLIILGIIAVLAVATVGFELYLYFIKGFRFVYPERFENSWNAVSGIAAWAGVVVSALSAVASFLAVIFAVQVADKQNKISLFEKRYELYDIVKNCKDFSNIIDKTKNKLEIRVLFLVALCYDSIDDEKNIVNTTFVSAKLIVTVQKINQIPFLFKNLDPGCQLSELITSLSGIVNACCATQDTPDLQENIQRLSNYINGEKYEKLVDAMQKELNLK